jgi:Spy/CpxP family protein refolding chaperone
VKNAKLWIAVLAVICFAAGFGAAMCWQYYFPQHRHDKDMFETLSNKLKLTPEQRVKAKQLTSDMLNKVKDFRLDTSQKFHNELRAMLTPEQQAVLDEMWKKRQEFLKEKYATPGPSPAQNP